MKAPRTIDEYLAQLRAALHGADPALVQDALYDAEEHLRSELAEQPGRSEAQMLERVVGSYGAPEEVAELYRDQEIRLQRALRPPPLPPRRTLAGRFFGVAADPRTYGSLFYMLLAFVTGVFYFTWAVTGLSVSAGLSVLIVGLPVIVLFFGSVRLLSLVEGRIVEAMLGVRMPRRPPYPAREGGLLRRIGAMFTDPRTWTALLYMLLMLPLGIAYFVAVVTLGSVSLAFIGGPLALAIDGRWIDRLDTGHRFTMDWGYGAHVPGWGELVLVFVAGVLLLFGLLHLVRGVGRLHGALARHLLVRGG